MTDTTELRRSQRLAGQTPEISTANERLNEQDSFASTNADEMEFHVDQQSSLQDQVAALQETVAQLLMERRNANQQLGAVPAPVNNESQHNSVISPIREANFLDHSFSLIPDHQLATETGPPPMENSNRESYSNPHKLIELEPSYRNLAQWYNTLMAYFSFEHWPLDGVLWKNMQQ